jgi:hypothetical protein
MREFPLAKELGRSQDNAMVKSLKLRARGVSRRVILHPSTFHVFRHAGRPFRQDSTSRAMLAPTPYYLAC